LAPCISSRLGCGFVPIRKKGKLPGNPICQSYTLEYGHDTLCIPSDVIRAGQHIVIIDDLLATGGTMGVAINLCRSLGVSSIHCVVLIELIQLKGREYIEKMKSTSSITSRNMDSSISSSSSSNSTSLPVSIHSFIQY